MKTTFLNCGLLIITIGSVTILIDSDKAVAQDYPELSIVDSTPSPPEELPTPALIQPAESNDNSGYQALEQGPVHEAFAAPVSIDPTAGTRVFDQPPPKPIDEQPPEADVAGMKWIPGYWSWSDEVEDYVWVSGLWRKVPQGRTWTPGFWSETQSGHHRWTSGYWAAGNAAAGNAAAGNAAAGNAAAGTMNYVPLPPRSIDNGPSTPAPGEDYFWVPGNWEYVNHDYRWRSGYWRLSQGDWVWQPACYVYTPRGYLLVDGYWDYLPPDRGRLYAPVTFYNPIYLQPNYVYRPCYPLADSSSVLLNLFIRPGYSHYYYGNFFGPSNASRGYRPWYDVGYSSGYITPWLGNYDRMYRKSGIDFVGSMRRYEEHSHTEWKQKQSKQSSGKKSIVVDVPQIKDAEGLGKRSGNSLDSFIRSDAGRVAFNPNGKPLKDKSYRNLAGPSSSSGELNKSTLKDDFRPDKGQTKSNPSNGSKKNSKSVNKEDHLSPSIQVGPPPAIKQKSNSFPSMPSNEPSSIKGGGKSQGFSSQRSSGEKLKSSPKSGGESKGQGKGKKK